MTILINCIGKFCYWCWNVQNTEAATGCVLKNFRKFAGKRLHQYLFVNKVAGLRPVKCEISYMIAAGHSYLIESCSENVWEISRSMSAWLQLSFEPLWFFQICIFSGESETLFFLDFNIIISHIFPENFIEIPQVFQKIWRLSLLSIFINFLDFLTFPCYKETYDVSL